MLRHATNGQRGVLNSAYQFEVYFCYDCCTNKYYIVFGFHLKDTTLLDCTHSWHMPFYVVLNWTVTFGVFEVFLIVVNGVGFNWQIDMSITDFSYNIPMASLGSQKPCLFSSLLACDHAFLQACHLAGLLLAREKWSNVDKMLQKFIEFSFFSLFFFSLENCNIWYCCTVHLFEDLKKTSCLDRMWLVVMQYSLRTILVFAPPMLAA